MKVKVVDDESMKDLGELFTILADEANNKLKILAEDTLTLQYKSGKDLRREKRKFSRKSNKQSKR